MPKVRCDKRGVLASLYRSRRRQRLAGPRREAKAAIAGLHKLLPDFTVQDWASIKWSDNPQFQREYARIVEGLRKAGLPEGMAKSN